MCPICGHPESADAETCGYKYRHPKPSPLAQGSLPVLDAEGLAKLWEGEASALRSNSTRPGYHNHATISRVYAKADQLETCAKELRLLMAHTKSRQPEENAELTRAPRRVE